MKARLIVTLLAVWLIMGCSLDSIDDPISKRADLERTLTMMIQYEEYGKFKIIESKECPDLNKHLLYGEFKHKDLGRVATWATLCTDYQLDNYLDGKFTLENGEEIYYSSTVTEEDALGRFYVCNIKGGTGRYFNATGKLVIYTEMYPDFKVHMGYRHLGEGVIAYGK
ncbi:MAG: hypothetical protein HKN00_10155 [Flavobacteriaceae bacterium]|nr:hypothetical protein [Bacteroidia bacterium]MBT8287647.1 hypothetical protein [Bacteroidia bacterium]NNF75538.1 hypothetical protein [Flavobacteriaceae bacterium]NNK72842.1 hypothetical protein [Flavobacteriaceae bacterium]